MVPVKLMSACFLSLFFFFFNDTATTEIYTLSLHDALPIWPISSWALELQPQRKLQVALALSGAAAAFGQYFAEGRSVGRVEANIGCTVTAAIGAPIRMVPDIVSFGAELEAKAFVDRDRLEQAHVPVLVTGLVDKVADALRIERAGRGRGEDRRAIWVGGCEPLASWPKCADDLGIAVNNPILAIHTASEIRVQADTGVV